MTGDKSKQNILNHVVLCLDASSSMQRHSGAVVKVADNLVADLAKLSKDMDQETRITIYTFADANKIECAVYDKDVLRLPSIASLYKANGNTALLKATQTAIEDLAMTPEKYGDHSYLLYIITDGDENASNRDFTTSYYGSPIPGIQYAKTLPPMMASLGDNWTLACLVPDSMGVVRAKKYGFPANNIAIWDTSSSQGMEEAGRTMTSATTSYMQARATGLRGTKNLFTPNVGQLDTNAVTAAGLTPLDPSKYVLIPVVEKTTIQEFVESCTSQYQVGKAFYQLTGSGTPKGKKHIIVQGNKAVAVMHKKTSKVYTGPEARKLVGLPDTDTNVDPKDDRGEWLLYIQSTSVNRHLYPGTKLLLMLG